MPRFDEEWMSMDQIGVLCALAQSTSAVEGEVVEIGTWQGRSAIPIANTIRPAVLHVVDHWLGDGPEAVAAGTAIRPELVARDNYGIFLANVAEATEGNVKVWKMDWREFVAQWEEPVRFLHLDGDHTTKEVSANIAAMLPYMAEGSVFAGDDWDWPTVAAGVRQQFPDGKINVQFNKLWWVCL